MTDDHIVPRHIGFIPDGNRRWARAHGLPVYEGHLAGHNVTKEILPACLEAGVEFVTIYAFSTENWKRTKDEVSRLMALFLTMLKTDLSVFLDLQVRLRVVGLKEGLSDKLIKAIETAEATTAHFTRGTCVVCLNYGGQQEIVDATKRIIESGVPADQVTPELFAQYTYAPEVPPIDLIVRTSGEQRLSNFMLWRAAYSELLFIEDKHWPDLRKEDITNILEEYASRNRRIGS